MYKVLFIMFFLLLSLSLEAYSKKIILASFTTKVKSDKMMKELPQRSPSLYTLAKKYKFDIKIRRSGKYYILVAEMFTSKKVLNTTFKSVKRRFKGAYITNYKASKIIKKEKVIPEPIKVVKKEIVVKKKEVKEEIEKKETIKKVEHKVEKIILKEKTLDIQKLFDKYFHLYYIVFFLIFLVLTYYYVKFKRIYDGY